MNDDVEQNPIPQPQRLLLDTLFLDLCRKVQAQLVAENRGLLYMQIPSDDAAAAKAVERCIRSVEYHEDKYDTGRYFRLEDAQKVQPAEGKIAVFEAMKAFCKTTGVSDEEGYQTFMRYYQEIPFVNGEYGERDVAAHVAQLRGPQRQI